MLSPGTKFSTTSLVLSSTQTILPRTGPSRSTRSNQPGQTTQRVSPSVSLQSTLTRSAIQLTLGAVPAPPPKTPTAMIDLTGSDDDVPTTINLGASRQDDDLAKGLALSLQADSALSREENDVNKAMEASVLSLGSNDPGVAIGAGQDWAVSQDAIDRVRVPNQCVLSCDPKHSPSSHLLGRARCGCFVLFGFPVTRWGMARFRKAGSRDWEAWKERRARGVRAWGELEQGRGQASFLAVSLFHAKQRGPGEAAFPHTPQGAAAVVVHVTARSGEETKHPALSLSLVCSSTRARVDA